MAPKDRLIHPAAYYSYKNDDGTFLKKPRRILRATEDLRTAYHIGQKIRTFAGAPGIGHTDYQITRINRRGVWGIVIENTMREMTAEEAM